MPRGPSERPDGWRVAPSFSVSGSDSDSGSSSDSDSDSGSDSGSSSGSGSDSVVRLSGSRLSGTSSCHIPSQPLPRR
ncbi:hypothetical protein FBG13_09250 [Cobetia marina]|nr:hypothetical protein FBG13_09250 [Cobetia marina]